MVEGFIALSGTRHDFLQDRDVAALYLGVDAIITEGD
jgi:hypothetical protein